MFITHLPLAFPILYLVAALLLLPNLLLPPLPPPLPAAPPLPPLPFILLLEKPLISPLLAASPLLLNRFFPPNPNFASFFCRLKLGASPGPRSRPELDFAPGVSTEMDSKRSSVGFSRVASEGLPLRSKAMSVKLQRWSARGGGTRVAYFSSNL